MPADPDHKSSDVPRRLRGARAGIWAFRLAVVFATLAAITYLCAHWIPVNATTAGFAYLIAILVIAAGWGFFEAFFASIVSVLCFNYFFFEPVGTFNIAEPENWVALSAFLVTSLVASQLSARARQRTQDALDRQGELEKLYALSRAILLIDASASPGRYIAHQIQDIFGFPWVALLDSLGEEVHFAGSSVPAGMEEGLRRVAAGGHWTGAPADEHAVIPILLGGRIIGSLAVPGEMISKAAMQALANLVAIAVERVRGQEAASRAEAARQSQELKSTLLDSLAHEFKTPLTSIKAAATALLPAFSSQPAGERELVAIINEEADHLNRLVTEATGMARIEAGEIRLNAGPHPVGNMIDIAVEKMKTQLEGRDLAIVKGENLPPVFVDPDLIVLAVRQMLDNALKYSPPAAPVVIRTESGGRGVVISVVDQGPGIPDRERPRLFEKFYRSPSTRQHVLGTGMGLAIAREIVSAHGGEIGVESTPGRGSRFWISIPVVAEEQSV